MKLHGKKQVSVAAHNYKAAKHFLKLAESTEEARFFTTKASQIFSAFAYEGFLNTLGSKLLPFWPDLDRLPVESKLSVISKHMDYRPDVSRRPYQTLRPLFRFRNQLAQGRDEIVVADGVFVPDVDPEEFFNPLSAVNTTWEAYCTLENARRSVLDVREIAVDLCRKAGLEHFPGYPFGNLAGGEFTIDRGNA